MLDQVLIVQSPSSLDASPSPASPYKLSKVVTSPHKLRVMKSLPDEAFLKRLETLDDEVQKETTKCFSMIYDHVVNKGAHSQGQPQFNLHGAATAFYEIYHDLLINNRDHGLKAGGTFNLIKNTLRLIEGRLSKAKVKPESLVQSENIETLEICKATLTVHQNTFAAAIKSLPADKQRKLKECQNIDDPQELPLSPAKKARIKVAHPNSPSVATPKKPSRKDLRAIELLLRNPDVETKRIVAKRLLAMPDQANATPLRDLPVVAPHPTNAKPPIPRALLLKYALTKATQKQSAHVIAALRPLIEPKEKTPLSPRKQ